MEDDYRGEKRLMEVISSLYGLAVPKKIEKANQQEKQVRLMRTNYGTRARLRQILKTVEDSYDSRFEKDKPETQLPPGRKIPSKT